MLKYRKNGRYSLTVPPFEWVGGPTWKHGFFELSIEGSGFQAFGFY
jgi:hypothetical protein